jgi:rRNA-processing protein FCF1
MICMDANALMMPVEADVRVFEQLDRLLADTGVASEAALASDTGPSGAVGLTGPEHTIDPPQTAGPGETHGGRGLAGGDAEAGAPATDSAFAVPRAVVEELERLAAGAGEAATAASVGLDLTRDRCRVLGHEADSGDTAVLECGTRADVTHVVTNDGALRDRLLDAEVPVISLRAENKLAVTQP